MTKSFKLWLFLTGVIAVAAFGINLTCFVHATVEGFIVATSTFETALLSLLTFMGIAISK